MFDPWLGEDPEKGIVVSLQNSHLQNSMDQGYSPRGCKALDTAERLNTFTQIVVPDVHRFKKFSCPFSSVNLSHLLLFDVFP